MSSLTILSNLLNFANWSQKISWTGSGQLSAWWVFPCYHYVVSPSAVAHDSKSCLREHIEERPKGRNHSFDKRREVDDRIKLSTMYQEHTILPWCESGINPPEREGWDIWENKKQSCLYKANWHHRNQDLRNFFAAASSYQQRRFLLRAIPNQKSNIASKNTIQFIESRNHQLSGTMCHVQNAFAFCVFFTGKPIIFSGLTYLPRVNFWSSRPNRV